MNDIDFCGAWKFALDHFFKSFLELTAPDVAAEIDWKSPCPVLDAELSEVQPKAHLDTRRFDKLFRVRLTTGEDACVLIHVEFEDEPGPELPLRLIGLSHLLSQRLGLQVIPVTLLAGIH